MLKVFRGVSLLCLCVVGAAVVIAPLELVFYPFLKSIDAVCPTDSKASLATLAGSVALRRPFSTCRSCFLTHESLRLGPEHCLGAE
jgi:hypothetical protein